MRKQRLSISDINEDLLQFADMYLKKVIINAKHHYYREKSLMKKHGIVFVDFETFAEEMGREENYESVLCHYIEIKGYCIPVYNSQLATALMELTEVQRSVLIQNVVLDVTLKQIACDLNISERMVRKHKHNAVESIRRKMTEGEGV